MKVYVDGQAGTTGLQILDRLQAREDITLLKIADEDRHNNEKRAEIMAEADFTFLCLPDDAAREAVTLAGGHTGADLSTRSHLTNGGGRTYQNFRCLHGAPDRSGMGLRISGAVRGIPGKDRRFSKNSRAGLLCKRVYFFAVSARTTWTDPGRFSGICLCDIRLQRGRQKGNCPV